VHTASSLDFRLLLNISPTIVIPGGPLRHTEISMTELGHAAATRTKCSQDGSNGIRGDGMTDSNAGDKAFFVQCHGDGLYRKGTAQIIKATRALRRMTLIGTAGVRCRPPKR
jgi:hypothetical protein